MLSSRNTLQVAREPLLSSSLRVKSSSLPCLSPSSGCTTTFHQLCMHRLLVCIIALGHAMASRVNGTSGKNLDPNRDKVSWKCKRCSLVHYRCFYSSWTLGSSALLQFWLPWEKFEFKSLWNLWKWSKNSCILWRFCDLQTKTQSKLLSILVRLYKTSPLVDLQVATIVGN